MQRYILLVELVQELLDYVDELFFMFLKEPLSHRDAKYWEDCVLGGGQWEIVQYHKS